ncbi:ABC transporter substrate-binding protein [Halobacteriaceae archaeon GCM10025711]
MSHGIDRRKFLAGVGSAAILGVAGCTGGGGGDGEETTTEETTESGDGEQTTESGGSSRSTPLKYGVLQPVTGDLGSVGKPIRNAGILPAKQLEGADLGGLSIDMQQEDTQTSPQAGISAANALVNAGYPAVVGAASSGVSTQVAKQVFIPSQVVACSPASTAPSLTNLDDNDFFFRTAPSDALQGQVMAQVAAEQLEASTAATMYVNNDYGQGLSQSFTNAFEGDQGGTVQTQVSFEKQKSSYTSKLQSALSDGPDTLIIIGYPASGTQMFKDYYADFGDGTQILVTDGLKDPKMQKQIGNPMENVTGTAPQSGGPNADAFNQLYKDEYGEEPGVFTAHAYDAAAVLLLANARAGENSGPAIADNMRNVADGGTEIGPDNLAEGIRMAANGEDVNYQGASSAIKFDENGDVVGVAFDVWKFAPDTESGIEITDTVTFG